MSFKKYCEEKRIDVNKVFDMVLGGLSHCVTPILIQLVS